MILRLFRIGFGWYKRFRLWTLGDSVTWKRVPAGYWMSIDPAQWLDQRMLFGVYEPWLKRLIETVVQPGDTCVDIGTHKGYFTLLMARLTGPGGTVYAFDPDPRAYRALQANRDRNEFTWIRPQAVAIGEREGTIELELTPKLGDTSRFHRSEYADHELQRTSVPMLPLDTALKKSGWDEDHQSVVFMKMDAEGSEPLILEGMETVLQNQSPILVMEFHFSCLRAAGTTASDLYRRFQEMGFSGYQMDWRWNWRGQSRVSLLPLDLTEDEHRETVDAVLVRQDSPYRARLAPLLK